MSAISSQAPSSHHISACLQGRQLLSLLAWTAAHMAWRRRRRYYAPGSGHQGPLKGTPPDWVQYLPSLSARHPLAAHPASVPTTTTTPSACGAPAATPAAAPLRTPCAHFLAPKGYGMGQLECPGLCLSLDAPLPLDVCVGSQMLGSSRLECKVPARDSPPYQPSRLHHLFPTNSTQITEKPCKIQSIAAPRPRALCCPWRLRNLKP